MSSQSIAVSPTLAQTRAKALRRVFLTARWQALAMLNWEIDRAIVEPLVPQGTELDYHEGKAFVSLVGFLFLDTRLLGMPVPFHRNFEEVNLRLYVRRVAAGEVRRGVSFVKEIVPRWAIAQTARWCYNEPYVALPMRHAVSGPVREVMARGDGGQRTGNREEDSGRVAYLWHFAGRWNSIELEYTGGRAPLVAGSHEEFITEHYWGYCRQRDGGTIEYQVEHAPWNIWRATAAQLDGDVAALYGPQFACVLAQPPTSAFLGDGSAVTVMRPMRIA